VEHPLLQTLKSEYYDRFVIRQGEVDILTQTGSLRIPIEFDIYSLDIDLYQMVPYCSLTGPCDIHLPEFVSVQISVQEGSDPMNHVHYDFVDYNPIFAPNYPTLLITWAANSRKKLIWSAGGFQ
jgi:hypothetical protein